MLRAQPVRWGGPRLVRPQPAQLNQLSQMLIP